MKKFVFKSRGFTPVPFLIISIWWAQVNPYFLFTGAIISILGEILRFQSIMHTGGATRTRNVGADTLVTSGPYAMMRNPLYLANMMIYLGYAIGSGALMPYLPIVALMFFSIQYYLIISLEEDTLGKLFGQAYIEYCQTVPRLFPHLHTATGGKLPNYPIREAFRQEHSSIMGIFLSWSMLLIRMYNQ